MFETRLHGLSLISGYENKRSLKSYVAVGLISLAVGIFGTKAYQKRLEDKVNELTTVSCTDQRETTAQRDRHDTAFYGFLQGEEFRRQISEANSFLEGIAIEKESFQELVVFARKYFAAPEVELRNLDTYQKGELNSINEFLANYEEQSASYSERVESARQMLEAWDNSETRSKVETIRQMRHINNSYVSALAQVKEQSVKERRALTLMMNYIERYSREDSAMIDRIISYLSRKQEMIKDSKEHRQVFMQNNTSLGVLPVHVETDQENQVNQTAVNYKGST